MTSLPSPNVSRALTGRPPLVWPDVARLVLLYAMLFVFLVGPTLYAWFVEPYTPLGSYPSPQLVTSPVASVDGPAIHVGDDLLVRATKCVDGEAPVAVSGRTYLVSESPRTMTLLQAGDGVRMPGCQTLLYLNDLPETLAPGRYRLEGYDEATNGERRQRKPWYTEWFTVLARPVGEPTP